MIDIENLKLFQNKTCLKVPYQYNQQGVLQ